jgi:hypothetical protein
MDGGLARVGHTGRNSPRAHRTGGRPGERSGGPLDTGPRRRWAGRRRRNPGTSAAAWRYRSHRRVRAAGGARAGHMPHRRDSPGVRRALGDRLCEGRRLAKPSATGGIELLFETLVLALQPIPFALDLSAPLVRACQFVAQPRHLTLLPLDQILRIIAGRALVGHACVMRYPRTLYKYNSLDRTRSHAPPAKRRRQM